MHFVSYVLSYVYHFSSCFTVFRHICHHLSSFLPPTSSKYRTGASKSPFYLNRLWGDFVWESYFFNPRNGGSFSCNFAPEKGTHQISGNFGESQMETILIFRGQISVLGSVYPKESCLFEFFGRSPFLIILKQGIIYTSTFKGVPNLFLKGINSPFLRV